jgi:hypothetical protein
MKKIYDVVLLQDSRYNGSLSEAIEVLNAEQPGMYVINTDLYLKSSSGNIVALYYGITNELSPLSSGEFDSSGSNIDDILKVIAVASKPELVNQILKGG